MDAAWIQTGTSVGPGDCGPGTGLAARLAAAGLATHLVARARGEGASPGQERAFLASLCALVPGQVYRLGPFRYAVSLRPDGQRAANADAGEAWPGPGTAADPTGEAWLGAALAHALGESAAPARAEPPRILVERLPLPDPAEPMAPAHLLLGRAVAHAGRLARDGLPPAQGCDGAAMGHLVLDAGFALAGAEFAAGALAGWDAADAPGGRTRAPEPDAGAAIAALADRLEGIEARIETALGPDPVLARLCASVEALEARLAADAPARSPPRPPPDPALDALEARIARLEAREPAPPAEPPHVFPESGAEARILSELGILRQILSGLRASLREIDRSLALSGGGAPARAFLDRLDRIAERVAAAGEGSEP